MQTSPSDISNEELARMIQQGFLEVNAKIDAVNQRLESHMTQSKKEHADIYFKLSETVTRNEHHALVSRVETLEAA